MEKTDIKVFMRDLETLPTPLERALRVDIAVERAIRGRFGVEEYFMERIVRNFIRKPIKGEITARKLKWRGISAARYGGRLVGVFERDDIVLLDGRRLTDVGTLNHIERLDLFKALNTFMAVEMMQALPDGSYREACLRLYATGKGAKEQILKRANRLGIYTEKKTPASHL